MPSAVLPAIAFLILAAGAIRAAAHEGHIGGVFHAHSLSEAQTVAAREHTLIFQVNAAPGQSLSALLQRPTSREGALLDLLALETVIVETDALAGAGGTPGGGPEGRSEIRLLDADGRMLRSWPLTVDPRHLHRELEVELSADSAVRRIDRALHERGADHYLTRERSARLRLRRDEVQAAEAEFRWCLEQALTQSGGISVGRRRTLLRTIFEWSRDCPAAAAALAEWNARCEALLAESRDDSLLARDWADLNHWLGDPQRIVRLFDRCANRPLVRHGLFDRAFESLVAARRYETVLEFVNPREAFRGEASAATGRGLLWRGAAGGVERGTRAFAIARGTALVKVLLGAGREESARELIGDVLRFDRRTETRERLRTAVREAGAAALADRFDQLWPPTAPSTQPGNP